MSKYKYRIIYLIRQLEWERYKTVIKDLADLCQVSQTTVRKWIYLRKEEHYNISFVAVMRLADFFNVEPKDIVNHE